MGFSYLVLYAPLIIALQIAVVSCAQSTNLTFMFVTSFGKFGLNTSGVVPAAQMAIRDINTRSGLLPGYTLVYDIVRDSQCQYDRSLDAFFQGIQSAPVKLAIIGCGCSVATEPVAAISHHWNISQISYLSASTALSDRSRYKRYFRTNPSFAIEPPAFLSLIKHFGWKRIGFLTQDEVVYTTAAISFRNMLENANYTSQMRLFHTTSENPTEDNVDFFLTSDDYRVFFVNSYSQPARKIICEAFRQGFTYPKYVWIMRDSFIDNWWTQAVDQGVVNCTDAELEAFLDKAISFRGYPLPDNYTAITDAGITAQQFQDEYEQRASQMNYEISDAGGRLYDAVWILAVALNRTMTMVKSGDINGTGCDNITGSLVPLEQFQYSNEKMGCLIKYNIQITNLTGVSGHIQFDSKGTRIQKLVYLKQYRLSGNLSRDMFAQLEAQRNYTFNFLPGVGDSDVYPGSIPPDGTTINNTVTYSTPLVVVFYTCAIGGEAFALFCLVFSAVFRNKRVVKLSSPTLNYMIVAGSVIMYASVVVYLAPAITDNAVWATCLLSEWLFTVGYALSFGALLARMWRVYYIFHNPTTKKQFIQDWHMVLLAMIVTGFGVCLLLLESTVTTLNQFVVKRQSLEDPKGIAPNDVREDNYILMCYGPSTPAFYLRALIFAYLAVLQIVGIMLAFQTRKVKFPGLKDSKFIAIIIYTSSLVLVVLIVNAFVLGPYLNTSGSLQALGVLILTTTNLVLIFVPKMVMLYRGSDDNTFNSSSAPTGVAIDSKQTSETVKMSSHEDELCQRDDQIGMLKSEIAMLKEQFSKVELLQPKE